jgi:hypothetical protein
MEPTAALVVLDRLALTPTAQILRPAKYRADAAAAWPASE